MTKSGPALMGHRSVSSSRTSPRRKKRLAAAPPPSPSARSAASNARRTPPPAALPAPAGANGPRRSRPPSWKRSRSSWASGSARARCSRAPMALAPNTASRARAEGKLEAGRLLAVFAYEEKKTKEHQGLKFKGLWGFDQGVKRFVRAAAGNHGEWDTASSRDGKATSWCGRASFPAPWARIPYRHTFTKKSDVDRRDKPRVREWTHASRCGCRTASGYRRGGHVQEVISANADLAALIVTASASRSRRFGG